MNSYNKMKIGLDIGGSVIKIVEKSKKGYIFKKIDVDKFDELIVYLKNLKTEKLLVTGGGAYKSEKKIFEELGIKIQKMDEMDMLVSGTTFCINKFSNREFFKYDWRNRKKITMNINKKSIYPYLLINIGSGVSILKVDNKNSYERVSGTSLGGGMFIGLCKLVAQIQDFEEIKKMSKLGDNKKVDLLVEDIYGGDYDKLDLESWVIASNFGKIATKLDKEYSKEDIIKSLMYMVSDNIAQISYLNLIRYDGIKNIIFAGSFLELGSMLWSKLSYGLEYWSSGYKKESHLSVIFLNHSAYMGALGTISEKDQKER